MSVAVLRGVTPLLLLAAAVGAGCGTDDASTGLECGAHTHVEGNTCVIDGDPVDGSLPDTSIPIDDAARPSDGAPSDAHPVQESGPVVHDGDPCPNGNGSACSGGRIFECWLAPNGVHQVGTLWGAEDCSLLAGACTLTSTGVGHCEGGGYTACSNSLNEAGNRVDNRKCFSQTVLEDCNGSTWHTTDCAKGGQVCLLNQQGVAVCGTP